MIYEEKKCIKTFNCRYDLSELPQPKVKDKGVLLEA